MTRYPARHGALPTLARAALIGMLVLAPHAALAQISTTTATTTVSMSAVNSTSTSSTSSPSSATAATSTQNTNEGIEAQVRSYFASTTVMIAIASCESGFRQFDPSGNPLMGGNGDVYGIFQISSSTHAAIARSMGMDIGTVLGNMAYANYLYEKSGTKPWISSFQCWNAIANPALVAQNGPLSAPLHFTLILGSVSPEVTTLQQLLNKTKTPVATSGPGSPGQETTRFGMMTKLAVEAFQCAQKIVCSGDEYTTGYGAVGPATRAALMNLSGSAMALATVPVPQNTPLIASPSTTTPDEAAQIASLTAQIAQLQQILAALLKARGL